MYEHGEIVHRHFSPGYVVLSLFVSCIGTITTLELLHRRTALQGWYNWYGGHGTAPLHSD